MSLPDLQKTLEMFPFLKAQKFLQHPECLQCFTLTTMILQRALWVERERAISRSGEDQIVAGSYKLSLVVLPVRSEYSV